jgi:hypothetical protein
MLGVMTPTTRHREIETRFHELLSDAGVPLPDETAHLSRAVIFVWFDSKAFVLVDLDEAPDDHALLFDGLDVDLLRDDVEGMPLPPGLIPPGFAQAG